MTWDDYKELRVKMCQDPDKPPYQWIYVVDDAWLHPVGSSHAQGGKLKAPIFELNGGKLQRFIDFEGKEKQDAGSEFMVTEASDKASQDMDAALAERFIRFAQYNGDNKRKAGDDYGVCFCSFEYFYEHYTNEINKPQNAVFFDLNHELRNVDTELNFVWKEKISGMGCFHEIADKLSLHGWILHFAMKLGCLKNSTASEKCLLKTDHILIISANLREQRDAGPDRLEDNSESSTSSSSSSEEDDRIGRGSAFDQYQEVQSAVWGAFAKQPDLLPQTARMSSFSFSPFPKTVHSATEEAELLDLGLKIFDRTFHNAFEWKKRLEEWQQDAKVVWEKYPNGHVDADIDSLKYWSANKDDLKRIYRLYPEDGCEEELRIPPICVPKAMFEELILQSGVLRHVNTFDFSGESDVKVPTNPSWLWIVHFIEFIGLLDPGLNPNRIRPDVTIHANHDKCTIRVSLGSGINKMAKMYGEGCGHKATQALKTICELDKFHDVFTKCAVAKEKITPSFDETTGKLSIELK